MEKPDAACCKDCCGLRTSFTRCGTVHAKAGHHVGTDRIEIGGLMMTLNLFRNVVRVGIATAVLISLASMLAVDSVSAQVPPPPFQTSIVGAPDLSGVVGRLSLEELRSVLERGRPEMGMPPPIPAFSPSELESVVAYLEWLAGVRSALEMTFTSLIFASSFKIVS